MKILIKIIASALAAASILIGVYCPLGYVAAAEPGMQHYRTILPFVFAGTIVVGFGSVAVLRKV